jgi:hypothetical protein
MASGEVIISARQCKVLHQSPLPLPSRPSIYIFVRVVEITMLALALWHFEALRGTPNATAI